MDQYCHCPNCGGVMPADETDLILQRSFVPELQAIKRQSIADGTDFNLSHELRKLEADPNAGIHIYMGTCLECGTTRTVYKIQPDGLIEQQLPLYRKSLEATKR